MRLRNYAMAIAMALCSTAAFAASPPNPCGNHGNNCSPGGGDASSSSNATGVGVGVGVGIGTGGNASATGGNANSTNINQNVAQGGAGGHGGTGIGLGGSATQGQGQKQGQSNTNVSSTNTATSTSTSQSQSSSANNNGNSQSLTVNEAENPDDITIRQAPTVMVAAPYATASCYKTAAGGVSGILGGLSLSGGAIDANCEHRELVRVSAAVDPAAAKRLLCLSEAYQLANRDACAGIPLLYQLTLKQRRSIVRPSGE